MFELGFSLRPATLADRDTIHAWMTSKGVVEHFLGPPRFPDVAIPTLEEFREDWAPHHFTHEAVERGRMFVMLRDGRAVGAVGQNAVVTSASGERCAEIDLWLADGALRRRGYGSTALSLLALRLEEELALDSIFLQPSARNAGAIRAYLDAGFRPTGLSTLEGSRHYVTVPDAHDSVFLARQLRGHVRLARVPNDLDRELVMPALRLADDSELALREYRDRGRVYALLGSGAHPPVIGHVLVSFDASGSEAELENLALVEAERGRGLGAAMLEELLARLALRGVRRVKLGTAAADARVLHFYQRLGFRLRSVERDAFTEARGYPPGLAVRGVPVRDRVWLDREL
jgi:RimJ/RimL family protein N-acetyltransferase